MKVMAVDRLGQRGTDVFSCMQSSFILVKNQKNDFPGAAPCKPTCKFTPTPRT